MTILAELEELSSRDSDGSKWRGCHREVISGLGLTRTLLPAESGALILFDNTNGITVTLPAPIVGMWFEFLIVTALAANTYSIDTDAATTFLDGGIAAVSTTVAEGGASFIADGTTDLSCDFDSAVTGWLVGTHVKFTCISSTVWAVDGVTHGVGSLATPF